MNGNLPDDVTRPGSSRILTKQVGSTRRTVFTKQQLSQLERRFTEQTFLSKEERGYLAEELGLTEKQIMIWFQNRRGRLKRRGPADMAYTREKLKELHTRRPYPFLYGLLSSVEHRFAASHGRTHPYLSTKVTGIEAQLGKPLSYNSKWQYDIGTLYGNKVNYPTVGNLPYSHDPTQYSIPLNPTVRREDTSWTNPRMSSSPFSYDVQQANGATMDNISAEIRGSHCVRQNGRSPNSCVPSAHGAARSTRIISPEQARAYCQQESGVPGFFYYPEAQTSRTMLPQASQNNTENYSEQKEPSNTEETDSGSSQFFISEMYNYNLNEFGGQVHQVLKPGFTNSGVLQSEGSSSEANVAPDLGYDYLGVLSSASASQQCNRISECENLSFHRLHGPSESGANPKASILHTHLNTAYGHSTYRPDASVNINNKGSMRYL